MSRRLRLIPLKASFPEIDLGDVTELVITLAPGQKVDFCTSSGIGYYYIDKQSTSYRLVLKDL